MNLTQERLCKIWMDACERPGTTWDPELIKNLVMTIVVLRSMLKELRNEVQAPRHYK